MYGFGEKKTPDAFVQACDKFIYTEVLRTESDSTAPAKVKPAAKPAKAVTKAVAPGPDACAATPPPAAAEPKAKSTEALPLALIRQAIEDASDESGWAGLGAVGSYLNKIRPDFDPRLYGHRKLSDLVKGQPKSLSPSRSAASSGSANKTIYIRALG